MLFFNAEISMLPFFAFFIRTTPTANFKLFYSRTIESAINQLNDFANFKSCNFFNIYFVNTA